MAVVDQIVIADSTGTQVDVTTGNALRVEVQNSTADIFEQAVSGSRYNQIEVNFSQSDPDLITDITVTKNNGGDAATANGQAIFSTSTNASGGVKAVSNKSIIYRPHAEIYVAFSAIFTTGIANSYQRLGLYDNSNGFYLGYEGTTFGITKRTSSVDTFVSISNFNKDLLNGNANSLFTRNGVPEAVDFTKDNLYRIRFGWLGAAPVLFEIFSPDCRWVTFHVIGHPNANTVPTIANPNLPITLDVQKTAAAATNLIINTGCWAAGTTSSLQKVNETITDTSLMQGTKSIVVGRKPDGSYVNIEATTNGNLKVAIQEDATGGISTSTNQQTMITSLQLLDDVVATDGSAALTKLYQVGGTDGTNAQILSTNASGHLNIADGGNSITVDGTVAATQSGTWNITNISGTISLPTGAGTSANQSTMITALQLLDNVVNTAGSAAVTSLYQVGGTDGTNARVLALNASGHVKIEDGGNSITVDGTVAATQSGTWNINNISGTISLPTGAATAAKQPALGTAGTASADVITVQGITGMTALKVDGSAVTQPVSGTITVQDGGGSITIDGTVAATQSGTWSTRTQDGSGNAVTSHLAGASRGIDVSIIDGSGNQITSFGGGTQYTQGDIDTTITGTAMMMEGASDTLVPAQGTVADGLLVNLGANNDVTVTGTVTSNQGSPGSLANAWPVELTDGTNVLNFETAHADAEINSEVHINTGAKLMGFNGTSWDRLRSNGTDADGEATTSLGNLNVESHEMVFNGTTWDRMRTASALDGTGATSHTGVLAVLQPNKRFNPTNLGTAASSTSVIDVNGANTARVSIGTTTTGTFIIEVTADGTNWSAAEVYGTGGDAWFSGQNLTPTSGAVYTVLVGSWRAVRLRTVTTLGATVAHFVTLSMSQGVISAIDTGPAPHAIGYTFVNKTGEYTTTQTGVALWTPVTGRKFVVTDFTISTGGTTAGIVTIWQGASADTTYTAGTDPVLFRGEFAPSATAKPGVVKTLNVPFTSSTTDHILRVTTSAAMTLYVQVNGYEII